jgi:hypothetical protein
MKNKFQIYIFYILLSVFFWNSAFAQTKQEIQGAIKSGQYDVARNMAKQLIKKNDPKGFNLLGWLEGQQQTTAGDAASFRAYLKAGELGDEDSQYILGWKYKYGIGTEPDIKKAIFWLEKASDRSITEATFELADILGSGSEYPYDTARSIQLYNKIYLNSNLMNTDLWVLSAFRIGWMLRNSTDPKYKEISESFLSVVMQNNFPDDRIQEAQSMIRTLVTQGKSKAGQGDGTPEDALCQKYGFTVSTQPYAECRMKIDIAKNEAKQRQALYDAEMARYNAQVAEYEKKKKREESDRLIRFGLALMGGTSPNFSENLNNANRAAAGLPPVAPQIQNFNIITPRGGVTPCTIVSNNVFCN